DAVDAVALAGLCLDYRHKPAAAVRLFRQAFEEDRALANNHRAGHRHRAALAAVLAATGKGDADDLPDREREELRSQALSWLRADLEGWRKAAAKDAARVLNRWRTEERLAAVREGPALGHLPTAERQAWRRFWADVEALVKERPAPG